MRTLLIIVIVIYYLFVQYKYFNAVDSNAPAE